MLPDERTKFRVDDLAVFGGPRVFACPKSTSNLVRPEFGAFLRYSQVFHRARRYTGDGPLVAQVEQRLAALHDTAFCVTFCSGFWALVLAISALAIRGRSEVVMPSFSYRRLADITAWLGLKPRFCEVDPDTLAMTGHTAAACVTGETALLLGVHPIVNCCDVGGLAALADTAGLPLLFDSVESVYESVPAGKIGRFGRAEVFSLHASKLLNGFEGGYVTTNDGQLARQLQGLRTAEVQGPAGAGPPGGLSAELNEVHAAMTLASLDDLESQVDRNRARYCRYQTALTSVPGLRLLRFDESEKTSYKNIVVELLPDWPLGRGDTIRILNAENILARAYYSPPLHARKMAYAHVAASLPLTDRLAERFVLMPCGHFVTDADIDSVATLLTFIAAHADAISGRLAGEKAGTDAGR